MDKQQWTGPVRVIQTNALHLNTLDSVGAPRRPGRDDGARTDAGQLLGDLDAGRRASRTLGGAAGVHPGRAVSLGR